MIGIRMSPVYWFLFVISVHNAFCQDPLPIMNLYDPSNSTECFINDCDVFTVRGKVNKNESNPDAYKDTNLYLQAVKDPSTNAWAPQCGPDLTVCRRNLTKDCYCESKDADGYYHLVMKIMAKSIYSGGKLMLSWNDARNPKNQPVLSNVVDYVKGTIRDRINVTLKAGTTARILDADPCSFEYSGALHLNYTQNMAHLNVCVYNLGANGFVQIKEDSRGILAQTTTDSCVSIPLNESHCGVFNLVFNESGTQYGRRGLYNVSFDNGCSRNDQDPNLDRGLEVYAKVLIVVSIVVVLW